MKPSQIAAFTASAEKDAFLDALERVPRRGWLTVYRRFEAFSGPQWARMFAVIADASTEKRLKYRMSDAVWDKMTPIFDRLAERIEAVVATLPRTAAGDREYRDKLDYAIRRRIATLGLREFLEKSGKGRKVLEVLTGLFDGIAVTGTEEANDKPSVGAKTRRAPKTPRPQRTPEGNKRASPAYTALARALKRKEARFEQPGPYTPTHGEELFEELFLTLDGVVQNGGLRHYLDNPSGDGAERAKAYLAEIGAWGTLAVLDEVSALFPGGVVPASLRKRVATLAAADKRMTNFNDPLGSAPARYLTAQAQLYQRLAEYVKTNRREFPGPGTSRR